MFTEEQRAWVKDFMPKPPAAVATPGDGRIPADGSSKQALFGIPTPDLGDITDMTSTCIFDNKTAERLMLVGKSLKLDHGKLTRNPDLVIEPGSQANWAVENSKAPSWIPVIGGISASGCEGHIQYAFPDGKTTVTCHFKATFSGNLPLVGSGNNLSEIAVDGPLKATVEGFAAGGDGANGTYNFMVTGPGGGTPGPVPGSKAAASCLVTVVNSTTSPITLTDQSNTLGDFVDNPAITVAPGASDQFAYVQTPGGEPGCRGSCTFQAGSPAAATWRVEWANPVGEKNTATATLDPPAAGFGSLEQSGQGDENVPFTFTLSGGQPGVTPTPVPPLPVEPPFVPPPSGKEPTLRKGDKSPDGWVEYLQQALNTKGSVKVPVDGDFNAATLKAVLAFQKANKLQVDGTVGNQTWAALRDNPAEPPSTDGRTPHTFEQDGVQARFFTEKDPVHWYPDGDTLTLHIVSVGDTRIDGRKATVRVTPPGSKPSVTTITIPAGTPMSSTDQGAMHMVEVPKFTASFPSTPPGAPGTEYLVEAYLEQDLGGDHWSGKPAP